jgi:hypothetical protein
MIITKFAVKEVKLNKILHIDSADGQVQWMHFIIRHAGGITDLHLHSTVNEEIKVSLSPPAK